MPNLKQEHKEFPFSQFQDMFAGGGDTSSTLLEWTFAELMRHKNIMKKLQEEIRKVVGYKSKVDENDLNQMNHMKCVVKESTRLHQTASLLMPRETLSDVRVKGFDIPSKTRVSVNAWTIQRDPEFWNKPDGSFLKDLKNNQKLICNTFHLVLGEEDVLEFHLDLVLLSFCLLIFSLLA